MNTDVLNRLVAAARAALEHLKTRPGNLTAARPIEEELAIALADVERDANLQKKHDPSFDGETYDPAKDKDRLKKQLGRVWDTMKDGKWRTLDEIRWVCGDGDSEAAVSARLRDLRKPKFGGYVVLRRPRGPREDGLFEYQLLASDGVTIAPATSNAEMI